APQQNECRGFTFRAEACLASLCYVYSMRSTPAVGRALLSFLLCFFATAHSAFADRQSISGKVTDPQGSAVSNATVSLVADDGKPLQQKATNTDGQFAFQN